jgi:hypothetical protein
MIAPLQQKCAQVCPERKHRLIAPNLQSTTKHALKPSTGPNLAAGCAKEDNRLPGRREASSLPPSTTNQNTTHLQAGDHVRLDEGCPSRITFQTITPRSPSSSHITRETFTCAWIKMEASVCPAERDRSESSLALKKLMFGNLPEPNLL